MIENPLAGRQGIVDGAFFIERLQQFKNYAGGVAPELQKNAIRLVPEFRGPCSNRQDLCKGTSPPHEGFHHESQMIELHAKTSSAGCTRMRNPPP
jgi:hypothetical protein